MAETNSTTLYICKLLNTTKKIDNDKPLEEEGKKLNQPKVM